MADARCDNGSVWGILTVYSREAWVQPFPEVLGEDSAMTECKNAEGTVLTLWDPEVSAELVLFCLNLRLNGVRGYTAPLTDA
eukprot:s5622_g3.t1